MNSKTAIGLSIGAIAVTGLAFYTKKQVDMISNDIYYSYDSQSIKIIEVGLNRVVFSVDLLIENKGELDIQAKDLRIKISSEGTPLTQVYRDLIFDIKPNSKSPVGIDVVINPKELITKSKGVKMSNWKDIPLTFKGSIKVKKLGVWLPIPFAFTYRLRDFV